MSNVEIDNSEVREDLYTVSGIVKSGGQYIQFNWSGSEKPYKTVSDNEVISGYILKNGIVMATISRFGIIEGI